MVGLFLPRLPYCIAMILSQALSFKVRWLDPVPEIKWIFLQMKWIVLRIKLNEYKITKSVFNVQFKSFLPYNFLDF